MTSDYDSQATYFGSVEAAAAERAQAIEAALRKAFSRHIELREVEVVQFASMKPRQLGAAIAREPAILKPLLAACNVAGRAIERDLGIRGLNTYKPRLDRETALVVAGYIKSFLPREVGLGSLVQIDRIQFIDKEVRALKGSWEKRVRDSLDALQPGFRKRKFSVDHEEFEIDAAWPGQGDIQLAVDVKRIEARRDVHKRCDEMINKAAKFKRAYPNGRFAAVVYYPFVAEHQNVRSRLRSPDIDTVYFAGATSESIDTSCEMMIAELREGGSKRETH